MKKILTSLGILTVLFSAAQCDTETAGGILKGKWNCEFETDLGVASLELQISEVNADSVKATYTYTTRYTGTVTGKIKGKINIAGVSQNNSCLFNLSGSWSEVTANGYTGNGNLKFEFASDNSFDGYWMEVGSLNKWNWKGRKAASE